MYIFCALNNFILDAKLQNQQTKSTKSMPHSFKNYFKNQKENPLMPKKKKRKTKKKLL
jgi:hypothetical protein